jgi:hypothetical protein
LIKNMPRSFARGHVAVALIATAVTAVAQSDLPPERRPRPVAEATRLAAPPVVDGIVVGDPAWEGVIPARGFTQVQPIEGARASEETEVFIGFTATSLYFGVVAHDSNPAGIIVADSRRDSSLDETDSFRIIVDGLLDKQNGYIFGTNPAGVEYDGQVTREGTDATNTSGGGGFNLNWDGSWNIRTQITDTGWSAEFEIPFTTLRYGSDENQVWGVNFQRNIRRKNEIVYWAPLSRQRDIQRVSEAGTVVGIAPPPRRNLQITPYVLGRAERGDAIDGTDTDGEFGFDIKYSITPSLTLDATYNTDFAQVEVDDVVVNLDRFNIFLPEKRPFFLENAGQFTVGNPQQVELFFSRRIGIAGGEPIPIDGGLRLSGKIGTTTNVGLLAMQSQAVQGVAPKDQFLVARVNQELPNRSAIGAMIIGRKGDGSYLTPTDEDENQTYAMDWRWGVGDNTLFSGWLAKTDTPTLDGDDDGYAVKMNYDSAKWASRVNYTEVGGNFNPEVGFLLRDNFKRAEAFLMRRFRPDDLWGLLEVRPHVSLSGWWGRDDDFLETGFQHYDVHWEFKNGYRIDTGMNYLKDGLRQPFEIIDGVIVPAGTYSGPEAQIVFHTDLSAPISLNMRIQNGDRFGGDRTVLQPTVNFRIGETFNSEFGVVYNKFDLPVTGGDFSVTVTRLRLSYSFTPKILLQALLQYNDDSDTFTSNLRFSVLRTANSGLYVVYNEIDERFPGAPPNGREFIVKYSYLFDVFQ